MKGIINKYKDLNRTARISIMLILLVVLGGTTITLSRFIYNVVTNNILGSQNFYFNSDFLTENGVTYTIPSWSGSDSYSLNIVMNSVKNELKYATTDIDYEITYMCSGDVECSINKESSTIIANDGTNGANNHDTFTVTLNPKRAFAENEEAQIYISVESTKPYRKTLSAKFILKVEKVGLSYEITDAKNDIFAELRLTNSLSYYTVETAFGSYNVGDLIQSVDYAKLSDSEKENCVSMAVKLEFDPTVLQLDMTDAYYLKASKNGKVTYGDYYVFTKSSGSYKENQVITEDTYNSLSATDKAAVGGPYSYVKGMEVNLDILSSASIKFYKSDASKNYTYPLVNSESIVKVS